MRPPLNATPRAPMTMKRKLESMVFHGSCYLCGEKLGAMSGVQFDHVLPLELGGADMPENIKPAHVDCHKFKTRNDVRQIAKSRRNRKTEAAHHEAIANREPGQKRVSKSKIPSRPFPGVQRRLNGWGAK